ncbi:MAG TPA: flagellar biosynthesis protein FlhF [Nitrospiraceae bacterium]|nr:flagellar biosynthesis protein FlhF [Nitrospiraceae bacterium]
MKVRTFYAASMHEAIRAIKQELGPDAVILSSRRVRKWGNAFGVLGSSALEVMAAIEEEPAEIADHSRLDAGPAPAVNGARSPVESSVNRSFQAALDQAVHPAAPAVAPRHVPLSEADNRFPLEEGPARHRPAADHHVPGDLSRSLQDVYGGLLTQGLRHGTAYECLRELQQTLRDPDRTASHFLLQLLRGVLATRLRSAGPLLDAEDSRKIALFVGPSGVGKTTSIAKLAAQYRLEEKRSVAMVTIDNYRPAAVEQLRLYANVLGIELMTASTCDEARDCIGQLAHTELVLVDTPGFNPRHPEPWNAWTALTGLPYQLEVHLVLSATTRIQDIDAAMARCIDAPGLRVLFTKLDETSGYGSIFEAAHRSGVPLSYWGTGPRVPEDLAPALPDRLVDFILGAAVSGKENSTSHAANDAFGSRAAHGRSIAGQAYDEAGSVTSGREHHHE